MAGDATLDSDDGADPARWTDREWVPSTWTLDGGGFKPSCTPACDAIARWAVVPRASTYASWNTVTLAPSIDREATFSDASASGHVVAEPRTTEALERDFEFIETRTRDHAARSVVLLMRC